MIGGFDYSFSWPMTQQRVQMVHRVILTAWPQADLHTPPGDPTLTFVSETSEIRAMADELGIVPDVEPHHFNMHIEPDAIHFVTGEPGTPGDLVMREIMRTLQANWMF